MNHRKFKEHVAAWSISLAITCTAAFGGSYLGYRFPTADPFPVLLILLSAFALSCLVNRLSAKAYASKHFGMSREERRALIDSHVEACKADPSAALAQHSGSDVTPIFLMAVYFLLSVSIVIASGFCVKTEIADPQFLPFLVAVVSLFFGWFLLSMPLLRIFEKFPHKLIRSVLVPVGKMPMVEAMIKRAADTVGMKKIFRIQIVHNNRVRIIPYGKTYLIQIAAPLLATLTEDELYQILLYHLEQYSRLHTHNSFSRAYAMGKLGSAGIRPETFAFDLFFSRIDVGLEWELDLAITAYWYLRDQKASRIIRESGNPAAAVSGLAKIEMWRYFSFESVHLLYDLYFPYYYEPKLHDHHERDICQAFHKLMEQKHTIWLDALMKEIHPKWDRRGPLFRERMQSLLPSDSAPRITLRPPNSDTSFEREMQAALEWYDKQGYWKAVTNYEANREREYLVPLRITEAYEASPANYKTHELSPVINAYRDIGRYDKAEALCDSIMATEPNPFALAHAIYFKGICMLHRYETEGIDFIYRAIDLNKNYMNDGFAVVEEYCTLCGLEDEYAAYLHRADRQISAHAYHHDSAGILSPKDYLIREEGLGGMLPDILAYMEKVANGCIREIYLVRKVISEDFFTSAFVIQFEDGASEDAMHRAYEAIFNYLDAYPVDWQFSLFVYNRETEAAVKQVEGSRVWKKNTTK